MSRSLQFDRLSGGGGSGRIPDGVWTSLAVFAAGIVGVLLFAGLDPVIAVGLLLLVVAAVTVASAVEIVEA